MNASGCERNFGRNPIGYRIWGGLRKRRRATRAVSLNYSVRARKTGLLRRFRCVRDDATRAELHARGVGVLAGANEDVQAVVRLERGRARRAAVATKRRLRIEAKLAGAAQRSGVAARVVHLHLERLRPAGEKCALQGKRPLLRAGRRASGMCGVPLLAVTRQRDRGYEEAGEKGEGGGWNSHGNVFGRTQWAQHPRTSDPRKWAVRPIEIRWLRMSLSVVACSHSASTDLRSCGQLRGPPAAAALSFSYLAT
jgi:hypothetical protein